MQQLGCVEDYEKVLIQFSSNIEEDVSEPFLLATFIKGLEMKIQTELKLMEPVNIDEALEWAVKIEEKLMAMGTLGTFSGTHGE